MKYSEETALDQRAVAGMNYHTPGLLCVLWQSPALFGLHIPHVSNEGVWQNYLQVLKPFLRCK